jgi:hypothetical protein
MSIDTYNVLVDFHCAEFDHADINEQFSNAIHTEEIGRNQHQVGLGVMAPNAGEAYRRAVNVVKAEMLCLDIRPAILGANVHGPSGQLVFD